MIKAAQPAKLTRNEVIKEENPTLAGAIASTLADPEADRFSNDDNQFLKFHGIYQQDDRDLRKKGKQFIFMIRTRTPGGVMTRDSYLALDELASTYGNNTLRITSRQAFQFHGVIKTGLGAIMKAMNEAMVSSLSACGDVNRNVMAPPTPATSPVESLVQKHAQGLGQALLPGTKAYHQIWVEGQKLDLNPQDFDDPLYGKTYLPRKFKAALAIPDLNDVDIFTNCLGFIAIVENGELVGYNMTAGGGLGRTHNNQATFPRMADVVGFLKPEQMEDIGRAVLTIHRDWGDRTNRKHARLKYVLEDRGLEWFQAELGKRLGYKLEAARPFQFTRQGDRFGWLEQLDGGMSLGLYVEAGRIKDAEGARLKSGLRKVLESHAAEVRLTPSQNLVLAHIKPEDCESVTGILKEHGVDVENQSTTLRRASMACPAMPTCGLALAESERFLPDLMDIVQNLLDENQLSDEEIIVRMTGCPNGCARPYMGEIGLVGKSPNKYQLFLGGNESSTRLNTVYRDSVKADELHETLQPVFQRFGTERNSNERFGDFCERVILPELARESAMNLPRPNPERTRPAPAPPSHAYL